MTTALIYQFAKGRFPVQYFPVSFMGILSCLTHKVRTGLFLYEKQQQSGSFSRIPKTAPLVALRGYKGRRESKLSPLWRAFAYFRLAAKKCPLRHEGHALRQNTHHEKIRGGNNLICCEQKTSF